MIALDLLLETVPDALVTDRARKALRVAGDSLPDGLSGRIGLGARLHADPQVDLLLLSRTGRQLAILADADASVRLGPELTPLPGWQAAARLARRAGALRTSGSPLPPGIRLEFDTPLDSVAPPSPAVFTAAAPDPASPAARGWDVSGTVAAVLRAAAGVEPGPPLLARVARIAMGELTVLQAGMFPGRSPLAVRLLCAVAEPARLVPALADCGWLGAAEELDRWAVRCAAHADLLHVRLDVTATGPLPRVGIEVSQAGAAQPGDDPRWGRLLEELRAEGLCTPAKAPAVAALGRRYEARMPPYRVFRQGLQHLEITVDGSGTASAKAYFGADDATAEPPAVAP